MANLSASDTKDNSSEKKPLFARHAEAECKFGIEQYTTPDAPGFAGVIKARYSDFIVHEVDPDGTIAKLDCIDFGEEDRPKDDADKSVDGPADKKLKPSTPPPVATADAEMSDVKTAEKLAPKTIPPEDQAKLLDLVGEEASNEIVKILHHWSSNQTVSGGADNTATATTDEVVAKNYTLPLLKDKAARKGIHMLIRSKTFASLAVADTVDQKVRVWAKRFQQEMPNFGHFAEDHQGRGNGNNNNARGGGDGKNKRKREKWPQDRPDYLRFVLYKENIDTGTAIKDVVRAAKLNTRHDRVGYAGMKDKRGITGQFCTLYRKTPLDLQRVNSAANGKRNSGCGNSSTAGRSVIRIGNFSYVSEDLRLGRLSGNRFDIVLRNIYADDVDGKDTETTSQADRFVNAKDSLQQIGSTFKKSGFINYFGMQRFGKFHDTHEVGLAVLKQNFEEAVNIIMKEKPDELEKVRDARRRWDKRFSGINLSDENSAREAEHKCAKSVLKALGRFNNSEVNLMQSLIIDPRYYKKAFSCIAKNMKLMFLHAVQSLVWNKAASYRIEKYGSECAVAGDLVLTEDKTEAEGGSGTSGLKGKSVKVVTEDDVKACDYGITDVVLPMIGSKIDYPTNSTNEFIEDLLEIYGLSKDLFKQIKGELSLGGDYRKLLIRPADVDWVIKQYSNPTEPLIETDLMKISGEKLKVGQGDKQQLIGMSIGFTLPPSSYATIALRELMKRPTDSSYQRELNLEGKCEAGKPKPVEEKKSKPIVIGASFSK